MIKNSLRGYFSLFAVILDLATVNFAQIVPPRKNLPNIKIKIFGQTDECFYRGVQPLPGGCQSLKDLGIKTIIDGISSAL